MCTSHCRNEALRTSFVAEQNVRRSEAVVHRRQFPSQIVRILFSEAGAAECEHVVDSNADPSCQMVVSFGCFFVSFFKLGVFTRGNNLEE